MVRELLGEPDELRPNPVYRSAAPMRLWVLARTTAAEEDPAFAQRQESSRRRSAASAAVTARKREELIAKAASIPVRVPVIAQERLIRRACASYNALRADRADYTPATPGSDPEFLERITVNYLRHELTCYEDQLAALFGSVGRAEAEPVIRERVYDAIASAYPDLAGECARQLRDRSWP
jgi:hypothetical protein